MPDSSAESSCSILELAEFEKEALHQAIQEAAASLSNGVDVDTAIDYGRLTLRAMAIEGEIGNARLSPVHFAEQSERLTRREAAYVECRDGKMILRFG